MMPGKMNLPERSTTVAPAGAEILDVGPMSRMWPFSITMVTSFCGPAPVPSMTVACVRAVTCAETRTAKNRAVARIIIALDLFIPTPPADCDLHVRLIELPQLSRGKHITAPAHGSMEIDMASEHWMKTLTRGQRVSAGKLVE